MMILRFTRSQKPPLPYTTTKPFKKSILTKTLEQSNQPSSQPIPNLFFCTGMYRIMVEAGHVTQWRWIPTLRLVWWWWVPISSSQRLRGISSKRRRIWFPLNTSSSLVFGSTITPSTFSVNLTEELSIPLGLVIDKIHGFA